MPDDNDPTRIEPRPADETVLDAGIFAATARAVDVGMERPGDFIGRYRLVEKIGEGGFGAVWRAEQGEPIRREVALKVIKAGMDSAEIIARFEAERQALALMEHPNIAGVLDAGTTQGGRPYFVMELVKGVPITEFADARKLTIRERLELFIPVCHAVQHAHQKAILHRDLKPSNILIAEMDGKPVPKVIDFGIAKALGTSPEAALNASLLRTQIGGVIGTPRYMSPEQAGASADMDTRSDIYTLGVILYELLTGDTPLPEESLRKAAFDEVLRMIRESAPKRPSSRVVPVTELVQQTAATRGTEPARLTRTLRGDLDWITLRALEKDRERRYGSAAALAVDIDRHLRNEPVEAGPPSVRYRLMKMVRRNKGLVAATVAIAATLIGGLVATGVALQRAKVARESEAVALAQSDEILTNMQLQRAEQLFDEDDASGGLAYLATVLRRHPNDPITAARLLSALRDRSYARQTFKPLHHAGSVLGLEWSPNGKRLVTVTKDRIHVWDTVTGRPVVAPIPVKPQTDLKGVRFSSDGRRFIAFGADSQVFDSETAQPVSPPLVHKGRRAGGGIAHFFPDGKRIITATNGNEIKVWEIETGAQLAELKMNSAPFALAMHPDGVRVAVGTLNGTIILWDSTAQRIEQTWPRMPNGPGGSLPPQLVFSPDGTRLFEIERDFIGGYDLASKEELPWKIQPGGILSSVDLSPDGHTFAVVTVGRAVRFFSAQTGRYISDDWRHSRYVDKVQYSASGTRFLSLTEQTAQVRTTLTGIPVCAATYVNSNIQCARLSTDGQRLAVGTQSGEVRVWEISASESQPLLFGPARSWPRFVLDAGERRIATSDGNGVVVWDFKTGRRMGNIDNDGGFWSLGFHPAGEMLLTGQVGQGVVRVWDAATGKIAESKLNGLRGGGGLDFSADGRLVIEGARVMDFSTGQPVTPPLGEHVAGNTAQHRYAPQITPDGKYLVLVEEKNQAVKVFDVSTSQPAAPGANYESPIDSMTLSEDGRMFAAGSTEGRIRIWRTADASPVTPWLRHQANVSALSFSPDGAMLATASHDQTARVWSIPEGRPLGEPIQHSQPVLDVVFCPDGKRIATNAQDGSVRIWDAQTGRALTERLPVHAQARMHLKWTRDGNHLIGHAPGMVHSWEVPAPTTEIPVWLADFGEAVAGQRLGAQGRLEQVGDDELAKVALKIDRLPGDNLCVRTAKWFYTRPGERCISPDSKITREGYAGLLTESESQRVVRAALHFMPENPRAWSRYVELLIGDIGGNPIDETQADELDSLLTHAEALSPKETWVWRARGLLKERLREPEKALAALRRAEELDPDDWRTQRVLAFLLAEHGENAPAIEAASRAIANMESSGYDARKRGELLSLRLRLLQKTGRHDEAARDNLELHAINPRDPKATPRELDLSGAYTNRLDANPFTINTKLSLREIPVGLVTLDGVLWDIRGMVVLAGKSLLRLYPANSGIVKVEQTCGKLHFLQACTSGENDGTSIGRWVLHYADGETRELPVKSGEDLRNWGQDPGKIGMPKNAREAWPGTLGTSDARLYHRIYQNPRPEVEIASLELVSENTDCAPIVVAITLE